MKHKFGFMRIALTVPVISIFSAFSLISSLISSVASATVDSHDRAYVVVKHIQSEEFFVEQVPIIGCYGLPKGPQLKQFTSEYKVPAGIGCSDQTQLVNINYLTCGVIVSAKESDDFSGFSEVTLDISNCEAKNDQKFIVAVKKAARLNFPKKGGHAKLILIM
jgi:hypothetical protein